MERKRITAKPLITHRLPLARFVDGIDIMRHRTGDAIKVVLNP
jgi:threonine dehydrogenase-like Zn-dependent dehydrogenase